MIVQLLAHTVVYSDTMRAASGHKWEPEDMATDIDALGEFAGRACYQSWSRPNPATATSVGYHANTLEHGHFSIYEHGSFTVYVEGVSRALTHELVRHRHLSYSQLSQRFVAEDRREDGPVIPPALATDAVGREMLEDAHEAAMEAYTDLTAHLVAKGFPRKQAREAARAVLPNAQETKIVVSGNMRAWRDFVAKRMDPHADAEIREFATEIFRLMRFLAPDSVQDIQPLKETV